MSAFSHLKLAIVVALQEDLKVKIRYNMSGTFSQGSELTTEWEAQTQLSFTVFHLVSCASLISSVLHKGVMSLLL